MAFSSDNGLHVMHLWLMFHMSQLMREWSQAHRQWITVTAKVNLFAYDFTKLFA